MNPVVSLIVALALSLAVIQVICRLAPLLGLMDQPDPRKIHCKPIPRVGGWGIIVGAIVPAAVFLSLDGLSWSYVIGSLVLFIFGVWDDASPICHRKKFLGQLFAVALVVFQGNLWIEQMPLLGPEKVWPAFGIPFTSFAIIGMINATNTSDGLDGLAGGESLISLIVIAVLASLANGWETVGLTMAVIGGTLGFLR